MNTPYRWDKWALIGPNRDGVSPRSEGDHPRFGLAGGANDVPQVKAFIEKLFAIGFFEGRRWLGFEVRPQPGESSAIVIANAKRVFLEAWAQVEPPQQQER